MNPSIECASELRRNMINNIVANTKAFFKNQSRDDPDLTDDEKYLIADGLFDNSPTQFLERYGKFLNKEDMPCLDVISSGDIIDFHKTQIVQRLLKNPNKVSVKNRRYKKMVELVQEGEYFSEEEMKRRNPLMFERMLGKFLDENKVHCKSMTSDNFLTSFCFSHLEAMQNNELYLKQVEEEERQMECFDEEEEEDDEEEEEIIDDEPSEAEKEYFRKEFKDIMKERFLQGLDVDFNYEEIDNDERLDSLDMIDRDAQDKYFDDDDDE